MEAGTAAAPADWDVCVDGLYESVGQEDTFAAALGRFRPFFNAQSVAFLTSHPAVASVHIAACDVPPMALIEYHSHFHAHDEWAKSALAIDGMPDGGVYHGSGLVPRRTLTASYFWKEFLVPHGISDIAAAVVEGTSGQTPPTYVTFHRFAGQPPYRPNVTHLLGALIPHLRRSLQLHRRLAPSLAVGSSFHEIFHEIPSPLLLLAADGSIVEMNDAAKSMLAVEDPALRTDRGAGLAFRSPGGWILLRDEIAKLAAEGTRSKAARTTLAAAGTTVNLLLVQGALTDRLAKHHVAAICSVALNVAAVHAVALRSRFALTLMETRVAMLLTEGHSVAEIARTTGCATSTVRTHVQALFSKTGTRRQGQLIAEMLRRPKGGADSGSAAPL